jgi:hypothetical protein
VARFVGDPLIEWSIRVHWHELLEPQGWQFMGKLDRQCGCPVWRRPGDGVTTDRSAIAHENDCEVRENREGHGSLHVFSDNVPGPVGNAVSDGQRDFTKLQFVALTEFGGDESRAQEALGLTPDLTWLDRAAQSPQISEPARESPGQEGAVPNAPPESLVEPHAPHPPIEDVWVATTRRHLTLWQLDPPDSVVQEQVRAAKVVTSRTVAQEISRDVMAQLRALGGGERTDEDLINEWMRAVEDTTPTHLLRSDGKAMLPTGRTNMCIGRRGCGKTWLALHESIASLDLGQSVAYVDLEDTVGNMRGRVRTMGRNVDDYVKAGGFRRFGSRDVPASLASSTVLEKFAARLAEYDVIVFDVLSRLVLRMGGELNTCNTEVAMLYEYLFDPLAFGAGRMVLTLAHPNAAGQRPDADARYIEPAGGATTMNSLSGMGLSMDVVRPFTRENPAGEVRLWCRKDRSGFGEGDLLGTFRGTLDVGSDTSTLSMTTFIDAPDGKTESVRHEELVVRVMERIIEVLRTRAEGVGPMTRRDIGRHLSTQQRQHVDEGLAKLLHEGKVVEVRERIELPGLGGPQGIVR